MKRQILTHDAELVEGKIIERPNRFTLIVEIGSSSEKVYLANPGALSTVIAPNREILCEHAKGKNRKTDFNAFAIKTGKIYVTVNSTFANTIFSKILEKEFLDEFEKYSSTTREPQLPKHGRADFLLKDEEKEIQSFVEIKSCTHVENEIAKFPDRPTKRGRRHLKSLTELERQDWENYFIFIVQRPDAEIFQPYREVDPEFADLLGEEAGLKIRAISTEFKPPTLFLKDENLPINLA